MVTVGVAGAASMSLEPAPAKVGVCTYRHGVFEGMPYAIGLNDRWRVVDFEKELRGLA